MDNIGGNKAKLAECGQHIAAIPATEALEAWEKVDVEAAKGSIREAMVVFQALQQQVRVVKGLASTSGRETIEAFSTFAQAYGDGELSTEAETFLSQMDDMQTTVGTQISSISSLSENTSNVYVRLEAILEELDGFDVYKNLGSSTAQETVTLHHALPGQIEKIAKQL